MNIRFDGQTVLITGGSAGIGLAAAELYGSLGAKVAICGTNPEKLGRAADALREKGITVFSMVCDVATAQRWHSLLMVRKRPLAPSVCG